MRVLSLFNGISCGRLALERAGIVVERYASYEIDKYANQIARANYPDDEYNNDVETAYFKSYRGFDIVMGGFPCTDLSIAKQGRKGLRGEHSSLFWELVRAIDETKCRYFLVENNASMPKQDRAIITQTLGVEPIMINSALVSAQNRKRLYWTNIPGVTQPEDKGILLKDILESGLGRYEKSYCLDANYYKGGSEKNINNQSGRRLAVFEPIALAEKSQTVVASYDGAVVQNTLEKKQRTMVAEPVIYQRPHGYNKGGIKTEKSPTLTANGDWQDNNYICEPVRIGTIENNAKNQQHDSQQYRVYSVRGKSINLCGNGGGMGAKTGLYYIDLPDGDYIIRKLTPVECERLQTLPDDYTAGISNTQRYKCIGNGWTAEVIAHILSFLSK